MSMIAERSRGDRALWCAVVFQVVVDANSTRTGKDQAFYRDEARAWLQRRTSAKDELIIRAGIDADAFWQQAAQGFPLWAKSMSAIQHRSSARRAA